MGELYIFFVFKHNSGKCCHTLPPTAKSAISSHGEGIAVKPQLF